MDVTAPCKVHRGIKPWGSNSSLTWVNRGMISSKCSIKCFQKLQLCFLLPGADVISFDGHGVISYRFRSKKMKTVKDIISLKFRTTAGNGVLLHGEGQQGDYISLELRRARLQLSINLGNIVLSGLPSTQNTSWTCSLIIWLTISPAGSNQYGSIQGHTSVTSGSLLDDDHWHSVVIERFRRNVNFTLDHHTQQLRTNGEFDHLDLDYEVNTEK